MSLKNNIFWGSDSNEPDTKKAPAPKPVTHAASFINPGNTPSAPVYASAQSASSYDDPDIRDHLVQTIKDSKGTGVGYVQYADSVNELAELPDERKKYSLAFKTLVSVGLTKTQLLSTANDALNIIRGEINKFESAFNTAKKTKVDDKRSLAATKQRQIDQLTKDVAQLSAEADTDEANFAPQHDKFTQTAQNLQSHIQYDIDKINQYIQ